jgi:hypothetical protein
MLAAIAEAPPINPDDSGISRLVDSHIAQRAAAGLVDDDDDDEAQQDDYGDDDFIRRQQEGPEDPTAPVSRHRWQENEILRVIEKLGYTAAALAKNVPGKEGVKHAVRTQCVADNPSQWLGSIFGKAWTRLTEQKRIRYSA